MSDFKKSKEAGDIGEQEILKILNKKYPKSYIVNKNVPFSDWDIYIPEINEGVEVKCDYKSYFSGNILIEVEMNGKLSALSKTKALYWVIITGFRYIWIKPIEIYRYIEQNPHYVRVPLTGSGDINSKIGYLLNHDDFVLHIHNNLDDVDGKVVMIKENEVMYRDNYINQKK